MCMNRSEFFGLYSFPKKRSSSVIGSFIGLVVLQNLILVSTMNVSNNSLGAISKYNCLGKSPHDATRLLLLVMSLNICSVGLDEVDHVAGVFPMDCHHIASLLDGLSFVVVKEESLLLDWFGGGVFHRVLRLQVQSLVSTLLFLLKIFFELIFLVAGAK